MRIVSIAALALLVTSSGVLAQSEGPEMPEDPRAKAALKRAMRLFEERDLDDAVAELEAGYAIEPVPIFMFSLATVERYRGKCERAITLYRCFLATKPPKTAKALDGLAACEAKYVEPKAEVCSSVLKTVASTPVTASGGGSSPTPVGSGQPDATQPRLSEQRSWYQDPLGDSLFGFGLASAATGVTFLVLGNQSAEDANQASNLDRYRELEDRADQRRLIGTIASGVGGALMVGGVIRWILFDGSPSTPVAVTPTKGGAALSIGGRF